MTLAEKIAAAMEEVAYARNELQQATEMLDILKQLETFDIYVKSQVGGCAEVAPSDTNMDTSIVIKIPNVQNHFVPLTLEGLENGRFFIIGFKIGLSQVVNKG